MRERARGWIINWSRSFIWNTSALCLHGTALSPSLIRSLSNDWHNRRAASGSSSDFSAPFWPNGWNGMFLCLGTMSPHAFVAVITGISRWFTGLKPGLYPITTPPWMVGTHDLMEFLNTLVRSFLSKKKIARLIDSNQENQQSKRYIYLKHNCSGFF